MFPRHDVRTIKRNGYRPRREGNKVGRKFAGYTPYTVADRAASYAGDRERVAWYRKPRARRRLSATDNDYHYRWGMLTACYWSLRRGPYRAGDCGKGRQRRAWSYRENLQRSGKVPWGTSDDEIFRVVPSALGPFPALYAPGVLRP